MISNRSSSIVSGVRGAAFRLAALSTVCAAASVAYGDLTPIASQGVPSVISHSTFVSHAPSSQVLHLNLCLSEAHPGALQSFVDSVSNPVSANFRHFIGPSDIGTMFGQPASVVSSVTNYLKSSGLKITLQCADNMHIMADGTVSQVEAAFNTTINKYHSNDPKERLNVNYLCWAKQPQLPSNIAPVVQYVAGMETATKHYKMSTLSPSMARVLYNTVPEYNNGYQGQGRKIGISNWDGFNVNNVSLFISKFGLPFPSAGPGSNLHIITINGGSGSGYAGGEGDLDQQMEIGQAPLADIYVYDGAYYGDASQLDVITYEMNDNRVDIISESYGWFSADPSLFEQAHNVHLEMNAEGITYMAASGDSGTYTDVVFEYNMTEPEELLVGGTHATVDSSGNRISEDAWFLGGGGWATWNLPFNKLPSWLKGKGVPTGINYRLNPDLASHASGTNNYSEFTAYDFYWGGLLVTADGTSCSSPITAGGLAVAEQKLAKLGILPKDKNGNQRMGRLQDLIYKFNGDSSVFFDVTQGNNGTLPNGQPSNAGPGWDTCTGWGAINWDGFVKKAIANPPVTTGPFGAAIYVDPTAGAEGTSASGSASSLLAADNSYYSVGSVKQSAGQVAAAVIKWQLKNSPNNYANFNLTLAAEGPVTVSQFVYFYNFQTGQWDWTPPASSTQMIGADAALVIPVNSSKYVSSTDQVMAIVRGVQPTRSGNSPFRLNLDQAVLVESY